AVDLIAVGWENAEGQKRRKKYPWNFLAGKLPFDRRGPKVRYVRHHIAHAVSAFFASGFERANVISLDAYGGSESGILGVGEGGAFKVLYTVPTKASWGHMYGKITEILGFRFHGDEGKVMGLAAYGTPRMNAVDFVEGKNGLPVIHPKKFRAFIESIPRRTPGTEILPEHKDLAATAQTVLENAVTKMAETLHKKTGARALCLGGGVALNCSMNGVLRAQDFIDRVFINPAAHDAGTALGAALWVHREATGARPDLVLRHPFYGPAFDSAAVLALLDAAGVTSYRRLEDPAEEAAELLAKGKIIGWFQGRMEFGPRALGHRSILADPGVPAMADRVNEIKGREKWRPLAPSILAEDAGEFIETRGETASPFMLYAFPASPAARKRIPAVVHVDGTTRLQTVHREDQPLFWRLLTAFKKRKGYGAILNTSFNLAGQPIVGRPRDALGTFFTSGLDALVMEDTLITKEP
ncbi:MAG: carbamoyltransferase family protein, partial [Planctomycetota bacterium]